MAKILVCVDGSVYADNICANAAWIAKKIDAEISLLHVLRRHSDYEAPTNHTGTIGLGARSFLMEELTKVDEERGRLDQQKGQIILNHCAEVLKEAGIENVEQIYRRGSLVETIQDLESEVDLILVGKRGEQANLESEFLGSNLEKVARVVNKPLLVVSSVVKPIQKFLIAYDGKDSVKKGIDYVTSQPLLKGLECHLLAVEYSENDLDVKEVESKLKTAGFNVIIKKEVSSHPDQVITDYVKSEEIDLLITGAYSHSRMRSILLGSTTASLVKSCKIPLILFR